MFHLTPWTAYDNDDDDDGDNDGYFLTHTHTHVTVSSASFFFSLKLWRRVMMLKIVEKSNSIIIIIFGNCKLWLTSYHIVKCV